MPNRVRPWVGTVALLAVAALPAACTDGSASDTGPVVHSGEPVSWSKVDLPAGDEPVTLTKDGTDLLVGLRHRGAKVVPRLTVLAADGRTTDIPVQPKSPYAFEAVWQSIATDGTRILALGGAPGGAHSNTRWTVWTGTTAGLQEHPQEFNTFGGQAAGAVFGAVMTPPGQALLGSWGSAQTGLDAAVWLAEGDKWTRQNPAGTALQSTPSLLVGPGFGTVSGAGIVLVGSQVRLAPNVVQQEAAVWRSTSLNQGWSRVALPEPGNRSQAVTAGCSATVCIISGYADGKLAIWKLEGAKGSRLQGLPAVPVGDKDRLPPPIQDDGHVVQVAADSGQVKVLSGDGTSWTVQDSTGPSGVVLDAAAVGDSLYLLAGPAGGPAALWRTDLSAVR
ncbi:MAG TPA: hypothetical protein VFT31_03305 [Kribbella sp.]|nr:hypothetical protein [Kribbella sp.]